MTPSAEAKLSWLAAHEFRLAWRDWRSMVTAGGKRRLSTAVVVMIVAALLLHVPVYYMVDDFVAAAASPDKGVLLAISTVIVLYCSLMLSQAMESVTRSLYTRGDLDLVLSSPVPPQQLFSVRIFANAALIGGVAVLMSAPFVDVLAVRSGPRWLSGFVVAAALGTSAGAIAVGVTIGLFRILGPRRTRIVAQVMAAVIGAAFAIGIQVLAILYYGTMSRGPFLASVETLSKMPGEGSVIWLPARAAMGDPYALAAVIAAAGAILGAVILAFAPRLGEHAVAATSMVGARARWRRRAHTFRSRSITGALRHKEWQLLRRDPWLVSQTLTQLLYLVPPAILLTKNFGGTTGVAAIVVMVLVSVGGQLAGALAWLAISGEDAPDMIATAPVTPATVTRAKVEAVGAAVVMVVAPLVLVITTLSWRHGVAAALGIALAAASTIRIQLWFRSQARRSNFRRRHTSSRIATFGEALVSFSWATAAGLAALGTWVSGASALTALIILAVIRAVSPRKASAA